MKMWYLSVPWRSESTRRAFGEATHRLVSGVNLSTQSIDGGKLEKSEKALEAEGVPNPQVSEMADEPITPRPKHTWAN